MKCYSFFGNCCVFMLFEYLVCVNMYLKDESIISLQFYICNVRKCRMSTTKGKCYISQG